jgi:lipoate-protein ligase A
VSSHNTSWFLLQSGPDTAARNMALDAALLEAGRDLPGPVLRFYAWTEPAASFGYFQKFAEIEKMTLLRPLVRRPTGGGLVPHDADWTYSLTLPPNSDWYELAATESYRQVHEWIRAAFAEIGVNSELADASRKALPGQCFAGHEKFDVLWQGRKIAGAAQRRTRSGLLIQGSVQPPPIQLSRADWERAMLASAPGTAPGAWTDFALSPSLSRRRDELAAGTYSQRSHNSRR